MCRYDSVPGDVAGGSGRCGLTWPFASLMPGSADVIVADPPWLFKLRSNVNLEKSPGKHYGLMTTDDVCKLPVDALAAPESVLLLWTSAPMLPDAFDVAKAWGFPKYVSRTAWRKTYKSGAQCMGCGYWVRTMHEDVLIFTRGKPRIAKAFPSLFDGIRREHSRKPDEFYDLVTARTPNARCRADLFSRESRVGFVGWGNEATKFDGVGQEMLFLDVLQNSC
jgi:N6-adenosine-specific RNA methylase IME4